MKRIENAQCEGLLVFEVANHARSADIRRCVKKLAEHSSGT